MTDYLKLLEEEAFPTGQVSITEMEKKVDKEFIEGMDNIIAAEQYYMFTPTLKELAKECAEDIVNNPKHYNTKGVECIKAIEASMSDEEFKGYLKGNCIKYIWRHNYKGNPKQDLEKAQWYLTKLIEEVGNE